MVAESLPQMNVPDDYEPPDASLPGPVSRRDDVVHRAHFRDAFPLCWSESERDEDRPHVARYDESLVTCRECLRILSGDE